MTILWSALAGAALGALIVIGVNLEKVVVELRSLNTSMRSN
jgi:hypothetical protein